MMMVFGLVIALIVAGFVALVALAMLIEIARRLFWFAAQLAASAAVAAVGAVCVLGVAPLETEWVAAPVALALAMGMLWASRGWGSTPSAAAPAAPVRVINPADSRRTPGEAAERARLATARKAADGAATRARARVPTNEQPGTSPAASLVTPALRDHLAITEAALAHAARDDIGAPAADWLTFWRRRVPDLIASAQDVWDDADAAERPAVAVDLAASLESIIAEADTRLAAVRKARHDLFTTRTNHARARVREG